jgi:hypothetical protein
MRSLPLTPGQHRQDMSSGGFSAHARALIMSTTSESYLQRANENAKAAAETNLVNVRERCLRAEAAWRTMAERLVDTEEKKKLDAQEKAQRGDSWS